jgi:hypothetical protein
MTGCCMPCRGDGIGPLDLPAASKPLDAAQHSDPPEISWDCHRDRVQRIARDHRMGIGETGVNIGQFETGIIGEQGVRDHALGQEAQDQLDRNPSVANNGFPAKDVWPHGNTL